MPKLEFHMFPGGSGHDGHGKCIMRNHDKVLFSRTRGNHSKEQVSHVSR